MKCVSSLKPLKRPESRWPCGSNIAFRKRPPNILSPSLEKWLLSHVGQKYPRWNWPLAVPKAREQLETGGHDKRMPYSFWRCWHWPETGSLNTKRNNGWPQTENTKYIKTTRVYETNNQNRASSVTPLGSKPALWKTRHRVHGFLCCWCSNQIVDEKKLFLEEF